MSVTDERRQDFRVNCQGAPEPVVAYVRIDGTVRHFRLHDLSMGGCGLLVSGEVARSVRYHGPVNEVVLSLPGEQVITSGVDFISASGQTGHEHILHARFVGFPVASVTVLQKAIYTLEAQGTPHHRITPEGRRYTLHR